jgi:DtxR family transcriptional regulator, manganese transport regulator
VSKPAKTADPPAEPAETPHHHTRTRAARAAATLEDYTELIAELTQQFGEARTVDIARRLGVAQPTAAKTIARLKREGLANSRPYRGVFLTEEGQEMARRVRARHRLVVEALLTLGVPEEDAEADAEGIEHYVSEATLLAFERLIRRKA